MLRTFHNLYDSVRSIRRMIVKQTKTKQFCMDSSVESIFTEDQLNFLGKYAFRERRSPEINPTILRSGRTLQRRLILFEKKRYEFVKYLVIYENNSFHILPNFSKASAVASCVIEYIPEPWFVTFELCREGYVTLRNKLTPCKWKLAQTSAYLICDFRVFDCNQSTEVPPIRS